MLFNKPVDLQERNLKISIGGRASGCKFAVGIWIVIRFVFAGACDSGSVITTQPMNEKMQASGEIYTSAIEENPGKFTFGFRRPL